MKKGRLKKRITEYYEDPLDGESVVETFDDPKEDESKKVTDIIPETMAEISNQEGVSRPQHYDMTTQEVKACGGCETKTGEARKVFADFVQQKIKMLKKGHENQDVSLLMGEPSYPEIAQNGHQKIKGTLAYAGVSLNNRLYLPEELAKGDGMTVPLIINHASTAGAEEEIQQGRIPQDIVRKLEQGEQHVVGEVTLSWDAELNTLFYEGHVADEFWQKEIVEANMAVSLGMYYDSDSPQVCNTQCYTVIKGAEFHEISLVYHPGFPIATIEAYEVRLKTMAVEAILSKKEVVFENYIDFETLARIRFANANEIVGALGMAVGAGARVGANLAVKGAKAVGQQAVKSVAKQSDTTDATDTSSITNTGVNEGFMDTLSDLFSGDIIFTEDEKKERDELIAGEVYEQCPHCRKMVDDLQDHIDRTHGGKQQKLFEAIGPHSREYDYVINMPTTTPEINSINATGKWEDPESRLARSRLNSNLLPQEELDKIIF